MLQPCTVARCRGGAPLRRLSKRRAYDHGRAVYVSVQTQR
ncbi:hypothetical protein FHR61_002492 [Xanthomonas arboricola]|uniref:Uncharacterized protein n=1 Tax=Xanthomonas cannabis TaxID=1885674 RepID=A0ABR6JMR5_9XANT|nr:hypothetical protein [Xanthomonas cannabis]MBB5522646.1 hypothetical protein [Xanthomonas cannabis]